MANEQNLIPLNKRSKKAQRRIQEMGRKANKAKIEGRKTLREELLALLEKGDTQERMSLSIIQKAIKGDTKAYEVIRDTVGEKPKDVIDANVNTEIKVTLDD